MLPMTEERDRLISENAKLREALMEATEAIAVAWAALGDNLQSQALGGRGIEKVYAHDVQSQLRCAGERARVALGK